MTDTPSDDSVAQLRREVAELRTELVEQEHRLFPILKNFFIARKKWPKDDPRRDAAWKALLWRTFFSPGSAATAAGIVGLATVGLLLWQNILVQRQLEQFRQQADTSRSQFETSRALTQQQLDATTAQFAQSRRTDLIAILYESSGESGDGPIAKANARTRTEALIEYVARERRSQQTVDLGQALLGSTNLSGLDLSETYLAGADLHEAVLNKTNLSQAHLGNTNLRGADLSDAILHGADLNGSSVLGADLRGVEGLDCNQLELAWNWGTAYRNETLACGAPIPEHPGSD